MGEAKRRKQAGDPTWGQKPSKRAYLHLSSKGLPPIHPDNMAALWGMPRDITDSMGDLECHAITMALADAVVIIERFEGDDEVCRLATDEEIVTLKREKLIPARIPLTSETVEQAEKERLSVAS